MKYVMNIRTADGTAHTFEAPTKDDLIAALYKAHTVDDILTMDQAIIATDVVEVKYGDDPPGLFSWTEGVKKEAPLEDA